MDCDGRGLGEKALLEGLESVQHGGVPRWGELHCLEGVVGDDVLQVQSVREDELDAVREGADLGGQEEDADVEVGNEALGGALEELADEVEQVARGRWGEVAGRERQHFEHAQACFGEVHLVDSLKLFQRREGLLSGLRRGFDVNDKAAVRVQVDFMLVPDPAGGGIPFPGNGECPSCHRLNARLKLTTVLRWTSGGRC